MRHRRTRSRTKNFNTNQWYYYVMSNEYRFECEFCGKDFGTDVMDLALHIGRIHDMPRSRTD